jgi:hypothetical protein
VKTMIESLSLLDTVALMATAIIILECVVMLRDPMKKSSVVIDLFSLFTGCAALFECVALLMNAHQVTPSVLALLCSLALALALMIAASVKRVSAARERRSFTSQLGRTL